MPTSDEYNTNTILECGPMPNVMVALPNKYGWRPLFNAAKFG